MAISVQEGKGEASKPGMGIEGVFRDAVII